jgi:YgiT-type zinc finger domain-containing protein
VTCGSKKIKVKRVSVHLRNGKTARGIRAEVCEVCGERYFDSAAMDKLELAMGLGTRRRVG